jgi:type I restriction enzyme R subunit
MNNLNEQTIEDYAIELLQGLGYDYVCGYDIAPEGTNPRRADFEQVLLLDSLKSAINRINPDLPDSSRHEVIKELQRIQSPSLIDNNLKFHRMLTEGIKGTYHKDGAERGNLVWLVDFDNPENNEFLVVNQFSVTETTRTKRPDLILFVNGLPLLIMELKNPASENATITSAFKQLQTYKAAIPSLFTYNSFMVISDGLEAKAGTISADISRFPAWKSEDGKTEAAKNIGQLEILINGMLNKKTLLDLIKHFIVFERSSKEDPKTGLTTVKTIKKLAAYHQYYAVNKAVKSTMNASGFSQNKQADRKGGVVWHTQGSGKSLSMVFFTGKLVLAMDNPTVVIITDRNDLDDQLFSTFSASVQLLRQEPKQAESRDSLKEYLQVASGGVIFTTIQKFQPEEGNVYETLTERENVVVVADEAHRTQYGFQAKTIDAKDEQGNVTGKKVVYGFAKYMRDALPNATYLGFTGTPIENTDVNTPAVFGNYIDIYDIAQAVEDGATVKIYYESRLAKVNLSEKGKKLIEKLDEEIKQDDLSETQKAKAKWTQPEALIGSPNRIKKVAKDIISHFEERQRHDCRDVLTHSRRLIRRNSQNPPRLALRRFRKRVYQSSDDICEFRRRKDKQAPHNQTAKTNTCRPYEIPE